MDSYLQYYQLHHNHHPDRVVGAVCKVTGVTLPQLAGDLRNKQIVFARLLIVGFCRDVCDASFSECQSALRDGKSHASAINRYQKWLEISCFRRNVWLARVNKKLKRKNLDPYWQITGVLRNRFINQQQCSKGNSNET